MAEKTFASVLATQQNAKHRCSLSAALKAMPKQDRLTVRRAMMTKSVDASDISRALTELGHDVSKSSVRRCRRGCDCWRQTWD